MTASYRKIDYRVRPAKSIERKMLVEAFRRLECFGSLEAYRYVGFGSVYFSDFSLFHKMLGFQSMISIEMTEDVATQNRFKFNAPYKYVQMAFDQSTTALAKMDWHERTVLWLDYDSHISKVTLDDIAAFCTKACSGSAILISVNATPPVSYDEEGQKLSYPDALGRMVGVEMVPAGTTAADFKGWNTASIYRKIISNKIDDSLKIINAGRGSGSKLAYRQIVNFHYEDGVKMLTVGGVLFDAGQASIFNQCGFQNLPFFQDGEEAFHIDPPLLTPKEIRELNAHIPLDEDSYENIPLLRVDIDRYAKFYRHFPSFTEAEL